MSIFASIATRSEELDASVQTVTALEAVIMERRTRASKLKQNVAQAMYRLDLQPKVEAYMLTLQQRVHERSVGLYETLLTLLVQDVIPENPYPISLELDTDKGLPSLSIQLGRNEFAQDIFDDAGGSLTNVVSSGLRFVALARSGLRRFLVLDEPDCWLEEWRVPRFADVLAEMASRIHVQGILISHSKDDAFINLPDRMKLEKNTAGLIEVRRSRNPVWADDNVPGIRWIRLERFMSHLDTKLELSPGINVLSGANHIGKSAIVQALRVFCYQQGADRNIMHGHDNFVISIGIEKGQVLTCTRVRKGGRKTVYSYMDPTMAAPRVEPAEKSKVPDFVVQALNIQKLNDLDIQLSHQKMPVFLLNEPKTKQASILSAGMESDHVRSMLKDYKSWLDGDRAIVRNDEKEFLVLKKTLDAWDLNVLKHGGVTLSDKGRHLQNMLSIIERGMQDAQAMEELMGIQFKAAQMQLCGTVAPYPEVPTIESVEPMASLAQAWKCAQSKMTCEPARQAPVLQEMPDLVAMANMLRTWKKTENKAVALEVCLEMRAPTDVRLESAAASTLCSEWIRASHNCQQADAKLESARTALESAQQALDELLQQSGGECPLCHQHWPHHHEEEKA